MLRDYQQDAILNVHAQWETSRNVLLNLPTGAGKTFTFSTIIKDFGKPTIAIAHRQELVGQMSVALGSMGIPHRIICSDAYLVEILKTHRLLLGKTWFDTAAPTIVAGVDTLVRRACPSFDNIKLWVIDEAHHVLRENKWGKAVSMFPKARGLGVTATPERADGKGLGATADGVFDSMVQGPSGQELIDMGYLSPYVCACAKPEDLDFSKVAHGSTGDFVAPQLRAATKASRRLVGSAVEQYLKRARGKLGITFCVDIDHAEETVHAYQQAGIPADIITGETPLYIRALKMEKFRRREILQLVNVDLFGEGVDVPGVEVVTQLRRTDSFALYSQQIGRALRPVYADGYDLSTAEGRKAAIAAGPKPKALILDHVGNIPHHLLPTSPRAWTLKGRDRKSRSQEVSKEDMLKVCGNPECLRPYPAFLVKCSYCGCEPAKAQRSRDIEKVDGDLMLFDEKLMAELDAKAKQIMGPARVPQGVSHVAVLSIMKEHAARSQAQEKLRETIAKWGGVVTHGRGLEVREAQKLFYLKFGVDVMTAQTLGEREASELQQKVEAVMYAK